MGMMWLAGGLPAQDVRPQPTQAPEQRLMLDVLHDALDCVEQHRFTTSLPGSRLFREAQRWFLCNEPDWPYSFESICAVIGLDSNAVRRRLRITPVSGVAVDIAEP